ncbi:hypothetical protein KKF03_03795 [Patescibacteria group bacterium]|nr:hypothetical protein [Patescibacteria group bacterium]
MKCFLKLFLISWIVFFSLYVIAYINTKGSLSGFDIWYKLVYTTTLAILVSWAFHSSSFGSEARANTADFNFDILGVHESDEDNIFMTPDKKLLLDNAQAYLTEHGYSVSYFANLINGYGDSTLDVLDIGKLVNGQMLDISVDPYNPEGVLPITVEKNTGSEGEYWQAIPTSLLDTP